MTSLSENSLVSAKAAYRANLEKWYPDVVPLARGSGPLSTSNMKNYLRYVYYHNGTGGGLQEAANLYAFLVAARVEYFTIVTEYARTTPNGGGSIKLRDASLDLKRDIGRLKDFATELFK